MAKIFTAVSSVGNESVSDADTVIFERKASFFRFGAKRGLDLGVASVVLLLLLPLLATIAVLTLMLQGRPILIRHKRVGRNGAMFDCLKFRSMRVGADAILQEHLAADADARAEWNATRKLKQDPRVTPLGHMMRKTSIDELPQLLNIVRGEMSLVGPRPIVPDEMHHYGARIGLYQSVRPGLTGAWQIGGRSNTTYARRVEMDSDYVANWSLARDLSILVKTVPAVLTSKGSY